MSMKNKSDTIRSRTCNLVVQCLNRLHHRVPIWECSLRRY